MEYKLSFYTKENQPYLKHPKWFEFWKKTKLIENYVWIRKIANIDAKNDKEALNTFNNEIFKEVLKQTHNEPHLFQLEAQSLETSYLKTNNINKTK